MNRLTPARTAAIVLPMLAAFAAIPAGIDVPLHPASSAALPVLWALVWGSEFALALAAPFSAYAIAVYGAGPVFPWLDLAAAWACAGTAFLFAATFAKGDKKNGTLMAGVIALYVLHRYVGPAPALAACALASSVCLVRIGRRGKP